jgi:hypothetical protein
MKLLKFNILYELGIGNAGFSHSLEVLPIFCTLLSIQIINFELSKTNRSNKKRHGCDTGNCEKISMNKARVIRTAELFCKNYTIKPFSIDVVL